MTREAVERAKHWWHERLQGGIVMPNGERVDMTLDNLYHALVDDRLCRHPERIEAALLGVFKIRTAEIGRRIALSHWDENGGRLIAVVIIDADSTLRGVHVINERRLRRYQRRYGDVLWTQWRFRVPGARRRTDTRSSWTRLRPHSSLSQSTVP